ncbi:MAG: hypothetical protein ACD_78C00274G0008 [uncultured bacterium (gcode 4)]|uniref:Uncharacterized protein n=1 Tax=uncultured bacterium (gcode 4) TaxID=1234023 RepID=K1XXU0_9BACT|nr:MAG: hypothetical protein ACD_78C00274G0008 [uncultured bacterium (gcode 4)]
MTLLNYILHTCHYDTSLQRIYMQLKPMNTVRIFLIVRVSDKGKLKTKNIYQVTKITRKYSYNPSELFIKHEAF